MPDQGLVGPKNWMKRLISWPKSSNPSTVKGKRQSKAEKFFLKASFLPFLGDANNPILLQKIF
jgi:hypothetical protein